MNRRHTTLAVAAFAALGLAAPSAQAQTYQLATGVTFNGPVTGASPHAGLTLSGGTLYGTTSSGGTGGGGTGFSLTVGSNTLHILANFSSADNTNDPEAGVTLNGNTLYGTTFGFAGVDAASTLGGTVYSLPTSGGTPTPLATFTSNSSGQFLNGSNPAAGLTLVGTTLYGTTEFGGSSGGGTVFSLPVGGGTPNPVVSFPAANPTSGLTLSGTTLYGTTFNGGANGVGSIFSFNTSNSAFTTLASFSSTDNNGVNPAAGLTLVGSTLYGTTEFDGAGGDGTLFSIPVGGNTITPLVTFTGTANGANPASTLTLGTGGILYGTTQGGGANNDGTVFSFNTTTSAFTTIATFAGGANGGATPLGGITLGANGVLYGTTSGGGNVTDSVNNPLGDGIVFSLTPVAAPEPSPLATLALGSLGLGALILRARRRRA